MQVLLKEFGVENKLNTNSTYEYLPNTNKELLIISHSNLILKKIQQKVNSENQCLSSTSWINYIRMQEKQDS